AAEAIWPRIQPGDRGTSLRSVPGLCETPHNALRTNAVAYGGALVTGSAEGLGACARLPEWLRARRHDATLAGLVGLMAGSLRALWPWQGADRGLQAPTLDGSLLGVLVIAALGFTAVTLLRRVGDAAEQPIDID